MILQSPDQLEQILSSNSRTTGGFIVVEGVNGAGKSTLIKAVSADLGGRNIPHITSREPGGCGWLGTKIREILLSREEPLCSLAELFLFCADRSQHIHSQIRPALAQKKLVILDRYYYSTLAFQAHGRSIDRELVLQLSQIATTGLEPDLVLLLDFPPELGLKRVAALLDKTTGQKLDSIESEPPGFHRKVSEGFKFEAECSTTPFVILDASRSQDLVFNDAIQWINPVLKYLT